MIFAIDPGNEKSAYALLDESLKPVEFGILDNDEMIEKVYSLPLDTKHSILEQSNCDFVIEMVASYGMAVGKEVFETVYWIGRFYEAGVWFRSRNRIYRMEEKINLCHDSRAKDSNVRQALIDRFGAVGTKKSPGWFYGVSKDVWAAIAVGVTYADKVVVQNE